MKKKFLLSSAFLVSALLVGCTEEGKETTNKENGKNAEEVVTDNTVADNVDYANLPQLQEVTKEDTLVTLETTKGNIVIKLFPELTPKTAENFVSLVESDYYNGISFHRVIDNFMIQTGDPTATGAGGESIWGESFEDEFNESLMHIDGAVSMANSGANTNGSQFFIVKSEVTDELFEGLEANGYNLSDEKESLYKDKNGTPWLDGAHTVFGQIVEGLDIVESISKVKVDGSDKPIEDVLISKAYVSQEGKYLEKE